MKIYKLYYVKETEYKNRFGYPICADIEIGFYLNKKKAEEHRKLYGKWKDEVDINDIFIQEIEVEK